MRFLAPAAVILMFLGAPLLEAQEHVAPSVLVGDRLARAARDRAEHRADLEKLLLSP
jgi:hypothetical protein